MNSLELDFSPPLAPDKIINIYAAAGKKLYFKIEYGPDRCLQIIAVDRAKLGRQNVFYSDNGKLGDCYKFQTRAYGTLDTAEKLIKSIIKLLNH